MKNIHRKIIKLITIIFTIILLIQPYISAHPHIFIDADITVVLDKKGLAGIKVQWLFDVMFSEMMLHDFDKNGDRQFNKTEQKIVKEEIFNNLKEYQYFTFIIIDGKKFEVKFVKNFSTIIKNKKMMFEFFIPCHVKIIKTYKKIIFAMYDKSYYTDIALIKKNPIKFQNTSGIDYKYEIKNNFKDPSYFGQKPPQEIILKFRRKT